MPSGPPLGATTGPFSGEAPEETRGIICGTGTQRNRGTPRHVTRDWDQLHDQNRPLMPTVTVVPLMIVRAIWLRVPRYSRWASLKRLATSRVNPSVGFI